MGVNTKTTKSEKNLGGRPPGQIHDIHLHMRVNQGFLTKIDDWRRKQPDLPNRTEAIRRLVESALQRK